MSSDNIPDKMVFAAEAAYEKQHPWRMHAALKAAGVGELIEALRRMTVNYPITPYRSDADNARALLEELEVSEANASSEPE